MKRLALIFGLIFALAGSASAQQILTSSPVYNGLSAPPLAINVNQFSEFNVLLMANAPIVISAPVVKGSIPFRINTCQDTSGGWAPTFSATGGLTIINRVGPNITTTTPGACDTEFWTYQSATGILILQSVSLNSPPAPTGTGFPLTGNVTANGWKIQNQGPGTGVGDGLVFGQAGAQLTNCLLLNGTTSGGANLCVEAVGGFTLFQFPATNGTPGQALVTDGTGVTSWATVGGGGGSSFPLTGNVSAGGFKIQNQGVGTTMGDGIVFGLSHLNDLAPATGVYSMNGNKIVSTAAGTVTNDVLVYGQAGAFLQSLTVNALATNSIINVQTPPYNCVGDGVADDTNCLQQAIYDAAGTTNPPAGSPLLTSKASIYLPLPTKCYLHTKPLRFVAKNLEWFSQSTATQLCQNYSGNAIIQESWGSPGTLPYDTSLVTGPGHSLITPDGGQVPQFIDVARFANANGKTANLQTALATGFNVAFFWKPVGTDNGRVFGSEPANPGTGNGAFLFNRNSSQITVNVNTSGGLVTLTACPAETTGTVYEYELDWDGTTYRAWVGLPGSPSTLCGSSASSNAPVASKFEEMLLPDGGATQYWPDGSSTNDNPAPGRIDSIQILRHSVHTASYTVPTTKYTLITGTFYLTNFETSLDGTQIGYTNDGGNTNIYSTIMGSGSISYTSGSNIHNMELCQSSSPTGLFINIDGIFAVGGDGSNWSNLSCERASYVGFDFYGNDFFATAANNNVTQFGGHIGFDYGAAWNSSTAISNNTDETDVACSTSQEGGGGSDTNSRCTDRGALIYGIIQHKGGQIWDNFALDQELTNTNFKAGIYLDQPGSDLFLGGTYPCQASPGVCVLQKNGGSGVTFINTAFANLGTPASIFSFTNGTPTSADQLINPLISTGLLLTDSTASQVQIFDNGITVPNASSTGTTVNKLAKFTGAPSSAVIVGTTDINAVGVVIKGAGTTGTATIKSTGAQLLAMDATSVVAGDYVVISTTTAGDGHDSGVSSYTSAAPSGFVVGTALESGAGSASRSVNFALSATASILSNYGHITNITNAASPYSVLSTDYFISCNATAGATVITMPLATGTGRQLIIKKSDSSANACTISRQGADLIDGATTAVDAAQYQSFSVMDAGSAVWSIF